MTLLVLTVIHAGNSQFLGIIQEENALTLLFVTSWLKQFSLCLEISCRKRGITMLFQALHNHTVPDELRGVPRIVSCQLLTSLSRVVRSA